MLETAIQYFLSLLSNEEASNKLPNDFIATSINWIKLWLSKEIFAILSKSDLPMEDKRAFLEERLLDLLKIPQFESELEEKLKQYSTINSSNAINNSAISVQGNFSQTVNHYHGPSPEKSPKEHDDIKGVINKVNEFVSTSQTGKALDVLKQATQHKFPTLHKETIQITGLWSDLMRRERVATISTEESARMRAQINERVLNTADEILRLYHVFE